MFKVVYKKLMAIFIAGITQALYRLRAQKLLLIPEAAKLQLVGPNVLSEITSRNAWRSSLQHQHRQVSLSKFFRDPATACT